MTALTQIRLNPENTTQLARATVLSPDAPGSVFNVLLTTYSIAGSTFCSLYTEGFKGSVKIEHILPLRPVLSDCSRALQHFVASADFQNFVLRPLAARLTSASK